MNHAWPRNVKGGGIPSLSDVVRPTVFITPELLRERFGCALTLALEVFQWTGSFKFRAAYNVAASVPHSALIAASSGNFGQALACACRMLGKKCTVVMPANSARVKIEAVRKHGATVDLIDTTQISRSERVQEMAEEMPDAYVASAYDDPLVIQGNASLGRELARHAPPFEVIIVPVGGGGLASGILTGLREVGSAAQVWGAEPLIANDAARSLREGHIVRNDAEPATIADGARTLSVGHHNWPVLRTGLAGIIEVSEENIRQAVRLLFAEANVKAEPTGALSLAALLTHAEVFRGHRVCCVVSGGNVDTELYTELIS